MTETSPDVLTRVYARVRALEDAAEAAAQKNDERVSALHSEMARQTEFVRSAHHDALLWLAKTNAFLERRLQRALWKYDAAERLRASVASDASDDGYKARVREALAEYDRVPKPEADEFRTSPGVDKPLEAMVSPGPIYPEPEAR